jgi:hypothetical protein
MIDAAAMSELTVRDLLATHEAVLTALRDRGVMRTDESPAQQYALWLAHEAFGGAITPESMSHDLTTPDGRRLQVRSAVVRADQVDDRQLAPFRNVDFDELLVVLFDASYEVLRAAMLTNEQVMRLARWKPQLNGRVLVARDAVLALGTDVRRRLPAARAHTDPGAAIAPFVTD